MPHGLQIVGYKILNSQMAPQQQQQKPSKSNNPFDDVHVPEDTSFSDEKVDVITYFLRPANLKQTMNVCQRIQNSKGRAHHRIVYIPQATAMCHKVLSNLGITTLPNVTIHRLQLDIFPLETDLFSLEYPSAMLETDVEQTPSSLITAVARSLLKLQDVCGTVPRIQSIGPLGEEVVKKMMTLRMEEYIADVGNADDPLETIAAMMVIDLGRWIW